MECKSENIGNAIPDIAGVGIILAFAILAGLSLVFAGIGYCATLQARWKHPDASDNLMSGNDRKKKQMQFFRLRRLELTEKVLGSISEVQLFNGIALLIAAIVQRNSLNLYHLHVVYDTVNFTAVSFTASIFVFWLSRKIQKQNGDNRHRNNTRRESPQIRRLPWMKFLVSNALWITVFCILYLVFAVVFGKALGRWDVNEFGFCYRDWGITSSVQPHPEADHIYVSITCLYMFSLLYASLLESHKTTLFAGTFWPLPFREVYNAYVGGMALYETKVNRAIGAFLTKCIRLFPVLIRTEITGISSRMPSPSIFVLYNLSTELGLVLVPLFQFLLHLYMVWAIRSGNRMYLQGESEDTWGFGQVIALVQILPILKGFTKDYIEYRKETAKWNQENGESGGTRLTIGICDLESSG